MANYPGVVVSRINFCGLFRKAWDDSMTQCNIKAGFQACRIFMFNPPSIPKEAFMPNSLFSVEQLVQNLDLASPEHASSTGDYFCWIISK